MKIFWLTLVAVTAAVIAGILALQLPQVQTYIADRIVSSIDDRLDADIEFEKIHIKPFTTLILKKVAIIDRNPASDVLDPSKEKVDTFFRADYIIAKFTLSGLADHEGIHLRKAYINGAQMNLVLEEKADEGDGDTSTDNLSRIFRLKKPEEPKRSEKEIFHISDVQIADMGFIMKNYSSDKTPYHGGIDWNDLDIRDINLSAKELMFKAGIMSGEVEEMSFHEKTGFNVSSMTGEARVGRGKTIVEDLKIVDTWSDIDIPLYMMSYDNIKAFSDFISRVRIDSRIADSRLDFKTLTFFAPQLEGNALKAAISGEVSGFVDDFTVMNVKVSSEAGGFSGVVNGRIKGIPDIENTKIDARVSNLLLTSEGLGLFISEWMHEGKLDLGDYARGMTFMAEAKAKGLLNDFDAILKMRSLLGSVDANINIANVISEEDVPVRLGGKISTENLDLGRIIGTDLIHQTTLETSFKAEIDSKPQLDIEKLTVDRLNINRYDYTGIMATGRLKDNYFDGRIVCHDPNLYFTLHGIFTLAAKGKDAAYGFKAKIGDANLNALNIDKRGKSYVNLTADVNFMKTKEGDMSGNISVNDVMLENRLGKYNIGDIRLSSKNSENNHVITFNSSFADGKYKGTASAARFIQDLQDITLKRSAPALYKDTTSRWTGNSYDIEFNCHQSMDLMYFVMPGMFISDSTSIKASVTKDGVAKASLTSPRIAYRQQFMMRHIDARFDNKDNRILGEMTCDTIKVSTLDLISNRFHLLVHDNHIGAEYEYDNNTEQVNRGEFVVNGDLNRDEDGLGMSVEIAPSTLYLNSRKWNILASRLFVKGSELDVDDFEMTSGEQKVRLFGKTSSTIPNTLTLNLERFDISILNPLLGSNFGIRGAVSGNAQILSPINLKSIRMDLICDSTQIAGESLGVLDMDCTWNEEFERYDLNIRNDLNGKTSLEATAKITPDSEMLDAAINMERLNIAYAEPFLKTVFNDMGGYMSGKVMLNGPIRDIRISSEAARLDNAMLQVAYTNVPYFAEGAFHIDDYGVYFDDIRIKDRYSGTGTVTGSINWNRFKDISFDTKIKVADIEGINVTEQMGESFYGNIFGTGNISITGPVNSIVMNIDAVTSRAGQLHIPVNNFTSASGTTNLLKFKEPERVVYIDPYMTMIRTFEKKDAETSDFTVNLRVNASSDIEAFVEIDKASGNVLTGRGNGMIGLEVSNDVFNINGEYTLTGGNYSFSALGIVSKNFEIREDSKITFNGDIMESNLDITASYTTKASLSTLLADSTAMGTRRDVLCLIKVTDKLKNPELDFEIEIPDLDPMIKSRVESALSTDDKVQKQFISLLVTNNFLPEEQSGIVNNSSSLVTDALANQLNTIFEKLDIPLDLGLSYQSNERGNDMFDVAVSTQLFNNRVIVNGNIGNKQYRTGNAQTDVVGDLDIEIKIGRSGAFRLNLFSHSADQYTNYLDNSQRNGIGFTYQNEFNTLRQFFKRMGMKKEKRKEARLAEEQSILDGEKVVLKITPDNKYEDDGK